LFVTAVTVVGALRVGANDQETRSGEEVGAVTSPQAGGAQTDPAHRLTPSRQIPPRGAHSTTKPAVSRHAPPAALVQSVAPVRSTAPTHKEGFIHRAPAPRQHTSLAPSLPSGPTPGTFTIDAPVLGVVGTAAVRTDTVELKPTGEWANTSSFIAPTATGEFSLDQLVQRSTEGVVSANLTPSLPTGGDGVHTQTYSSDVSTTATADGNVLVNVALQVIPAATMSTATSVTPSLPTALNINVHAVYTADVTQVLAETVTVVEGSAPCCVSLATTTPLNTSSGSGTSPLPLAPTAVGSASVSPMSLTKRDDQAPASSS
jgi:hypothetical protein